MNSADLPKEPIAVRLNRIAYLISVCVAASTVIVGFFVVVMRPEIDRLEREPFETIQDVIRTRFSETYSEVARLRNEVASISQILAQAQSLSSESAAAMAIGNLKAELYSIQERLEVIDTIEKAIVENPERAMSLPMLRKDIDRLGLSTTRDLEALRQELGRMYELNKWFIGLMATMAVGVLGLAVGNLLKRKDE